MPTSGRLWNFIRGKIVKPYESPKVLRIVYHLYLCLMKKERGKNSGFYLAGE